MRSLMAVVAVVAFFVSAKADAAPSGKTPAGAAEFVQSFYDWYVPFSRKNLRAPEPSARLAIKAKPQLFSAQLRQALEADFAAQAKDSGYIVGIDFDPFTASQDQADRYVAGSVHQLGSDYQVDVYGITSGKKDAQPDANVTVEMQNGHWVMTDFHYKDSGDLLATLRSLKADREKK